jgi:hypothetical protein
MLSSDRYSWVMNANSSRRFFLELTALDVGIVHGAMRLLLMHPTVEETYTDDFKRLAGHLRRWCLVRFREMGFTEEEVRELDSELA